MSEYEYISVRKDWDYTPDIVNMENKNAYVQDTRAYQLLVDLLHRRTQGAFLLSGRRGIGKTTQVVHAIEKVKELEEEVRTKTFVISVDASNFEIYAKEKQDVQGIADVDPTKAKYSILQNICLELTKELHTELTNSQKVNGTTRTHKFDKLRLRMRGKTKSLNYADEVLLEKTIDLMNKAKATRISTEASLQSLIQNKLNVSSESTISLQTAMKLPLISIPFIAAGIVWSMLSLRPTGIPILDSILPIVVASIPPVAIAISWNIKKIKMSSKEKEQRTSTNLSYEYDANAMRDDLKIILSMLSKKNYKVIFVIDNLDQVNQGFMASLTGLKKLLLHTESAYYIFIGDEGYYTYITESREKRSRESNLFTQNIFLPRPSFEEMKKYVDKIVHTHESDNIRK